jgi:colanic acid biosynthesis glycosyl transferase WcaI
MKIRFITPYYPPETGAPQTRIYELAVRLVKLGHEVSVVTTFPNYPTGIVPREWRGRLRWTGVQDGIRIWRFWSYAAPNRGFLKRIATHLSFAVSAALGALTLPYCDVMVVESPPLFDGFAAVLLSILRRTPYAFTVSDLWPESAVQMGILRSPVLIRVSKWAELLFYRRAAVVLGLTRGICDKIVADGIPSSKVVVFRNSVDCDFFRPGIDATALRREIEVADNEYMVLYAGTLGLAQGLSTVLDAAALLRLEGYSGIRFVLAGNGAESDQLREKAALLGLENLSFTDSFPKPRMPELLNAADCILVPLRDLEIFRGALPTKMFEGMACAKPIVLAIRGEAEEIIRKADAGECVPPENPAAIRTAVLSFVANPQRARNLGENGRRLVTQRFSRDVRARQLGKYLSRVIAPKLADKNTAGEPISMPVLDSLSDKSLHR